MKYFMKAVSQREQKGYRGDTGRVHTLGDVSQKKQWPAESVYQLILQFQIFSQPWIDLTRLRH